MKYSIDYQYLAKGARRPSDDGVVVGITATDESGLVLLPNIGDFITIANQASKEGHSSFEGKVRSRLFRYIRAGDELFCHVNIVVEESDEDWDKLIKE